MLESENIFGNASTSKKKFKKFGFYFLMLMIPILVIIIATVSINQEFKKFKNDFSTQMKNISSTFKHGLEKVKNDTKDSLDNLQQDFNGIKKDFNVANQYLNQLRILNGSYEDIGIVMNPGTRNQDFGLW